MSGNQQSAAKRIFVSIEEKRLIDQMLLMDSPTRTALSQTLGVSPAWITKTITPLIKCGIIEETGSAARSGGRRARTLGFGKAVGYFLGVNYGRTCLSIALAGPNRKIIAKNRVPIEINDGPDTCLHALEKMVMQLLDSVKVEKSQIRGVGIGMPGPVNFLAERLTSLRFMPGWDDYPISEKLMAVFQGSTIVVDNNVNLMALGALYHGEGMGAGSFIYLKIGSSIGAGIICKEKLYCGSTGCAGDVGHIVVKSDGPLCHCGNSGCVEALAGGLAIAQEAIKLAKSGESEILAQKYQSGGGRLSAEDVGMAAAQGDLAALELIDRSGNYIGEMLTHLVGFYNPDLILIGGGVSKIGHRLINAIRRVVLKRSSPLATRNLRIEYSQLGEDAGLHGAIRLVQQRLFYAPGVDEGDW
jgi:glucokinase-like ROK family protein